MRPRFIVFLALLFGTVLVVLPTRAQDTPFDLNAAIDAAAPGETVHVPAGVYQGPLHIDRPIVLEGQGWPVIKGTGRGDVITVNAPDVTLRGLVIRGSGDVLDQENAGVTGLAPRLTIENNRLEDVLFGIYIKDAPGSVLRGNVVRSKPLDLGRRGDGIRLWYSANSLLEDNHVIGSRDVVVWFSPDSVLRGNVVEEGRYGLHFMFSDNQLLEENVLRHNSVGAFLMYGHGLTMRRNLMLDNHGPSGYGVGLKDVDNIMAEGNRFIGNRIGVYVDNSPRELDATVLFDHNLIAYNEIGLNLQPLTRRNTYTGNIFQDNGEQVALTTGGQLQGNQWSREDAGNYWSDYAGFDADGDHIGDIPYRSQSLYEDLMQSEPALRLFQMSPASQALDMAARAFPIFQPRPTMADDRPLMAPPALPPVPGLRPPPILANALIAAALLVCAFFILTLGAGISRRDFLFRHA